MRYILLPDQRLLDPETEDIVGTFNRETSEIDLQHPTLLQQVGSMKELGEDPTFAKDGKGREVQGCGRPLFRGPQRLLVSTRRGSRPGDGYHQVTCHLVRVENMFCVAVCVIMRDACEFLDPLFINVL